MGSAAVQACAGVAGLGQVCFFYISISHVSVAFGNVCDDNWGHMGCLTSADCNAACEHLCDDGARVQSGFDRHQEQGAPWHQVTPHRLLG